MTEPIRLGIFGWPVAHSKSPQMHEAAAKALGLDLRYERFAVEPADLAGTSDPSLGVSGDAERRIDRVRTGLEVPGF